MERLIVLFLSDIFSKFSFPGRYRILNSLYSYKRTAFQKGVWLVKSYLEPRHKLQINLFSKDLIDHKILFTGAYEPGTNLILESHIRPGDVVLEAGANTGTETLLISRLIGNEGNVLAFEPVPHVIEKLKTNLSLNKITNVSINTVALGDSNREISFYIYPQNHPNQGMGSKVLEHSGLEKITVSQTTLDSLMKEGTLPRIDFLKMDVQGAELDILRGGINSISTYRPKIFLEAADSLSNLLAIYTYLTELKYVVSLIRSDGKLEKLNADELIMGNWLALPTNKPS